MEPVWIFGGINVGMLIVGGVFHYSRVVTRDDLYNKDGTTKYVPRQECREDRSECTTRLCKKLDDIIAAQQAHDKKHEAISEFVGEVRQFMKGK